MKFMAERRLLCELGRRMWQRGWIAGGGGNLSMRLSEDRLLVTPAGVSKGFLTPDMPVLTDGAGEPLDEGSPWAPTSELALHLACYAQREDVRGVCHAHPPAATAFACARRGLDTAAISEAALVLGEVPCAPYARTGTAALAQAAAPLVRDHSGVLLANHGALTLGRDVEAAYFLMETLEHTARVGLHLTRLGGGAPLPPEELAALGGQVR